MAYNLLSNLFLTCKKKKYHVSRGPSYNDNYSPAHIVQRMDFLEYLHEHYKEDLFLILSIIFTKGKYY